MPTAEVNDSGPAGSPIFIVGEAPGREEVLAGAPFVGPSGVLLRQMLSHSGIDAATCYITNVITHRPIKNDFSVYYTDRQKKNPTPELLKAWDILRSKVSISKPKIVIACGSEALRALTGHKSIEAWRGCPLSADFNGYRCTVIPTYHPAAVLRQYSFHPTVELDLQKAKRLADGITSATPQPSFKLRPTVTDVIEFLDKCKQHVCAFDLESVGRTVRCLGIARQNEVMCIPFIKWQESGSDLIGQGLIPLSTNAGLASSYWSVSDEMRVIQALGAFFSDPSIVKVGHNSVSFDQPFLEKEFGFVFVNHVFDTMHSWHLLYPELPKGLDYLCSVLTDYPNYWSHKHVQVDTDEWTYNCWDCWVTLQAYPIIKKELTEAGLLDFYNRHIHKLAISLTRAQERGVLVDQTKRLELKQRYELERDNRQAEVRRLADNQKLNLNSSLQLKKLFYEQLGCREVYGRKQTVSTDEECICKLRNSYPSYSTLFDNILAYRAATKLLEFLACETTPKGRMQTSYNVSGTTTGRISSSQTIHGTGMNLQNVPKPVRGIFIAGPDRSLVKQDLSQAETMVVAHILKRVGDLTLYNKYKEPNFDIHNWMSSIIYKRPESDITRDERQVGKLGNHSGNYRAGPRVLEKKALQDGIRGINYDVAKEILSIRGQAIPGLAVWWDWVERELSRTRTLWTCLGRRRIFFGRLDHSTFREATAFEPQSLVGDVNNIIFRELDRLLDPDCWPLLQVHDECVVDCPSNKVAHVIEVLKEVSNIELWINKDEPLIIPGDISVGQNWAECKEPDA